MRIYLIPLVALLLSLSACGSDSPQALPADKAPAAGLQGDPALPSTDTLETDTTLAPGKDEEDIASLKVIGRAWTGDLDTMEERRVIRVLTVYSPGRYYLEDNGAEQGLVKEISTRFEQFINSRLQRKTVKVHVAIIPVARSQLVPALLAGYGDIINAGLSITAQRDEIVDFSIPSSKPFSEILVTGPSAPQVESIDDLSGKTLYVRDSSSYRESVEALSRRFEAAGRDPVQIELVSEYLEDDDLIEMVDKGLLPWVVVDDYKTELWKDVFTNVTARHDIELRRDGQIAWAFRENSPLLEAAVNDFLKKNREGTLIGNVLRNRYIRDFDWAANALNEADYQRFLELEHLFKKYGEQYRVDYLLAAAQGYQESRHDQSARSAAGAVGVMQLLPTTARDKNIGIDNIHEVEPNIHAGIKYLDFLRSRYFSDPAIDPRNQTLLALAAYNMGPSRMINLRAKAEQTGYDPNQWFDNVEIVAAREVGREPVQYVANIYKYYIAYRYTLAHQEGHAVARQRAGISPYRSIDE